MIYEYKNSYTPTDEGAGYSQNDAGGPGAGSHDGGRREHHIVSVCDGRNTYDLKVRHGRTLRSVLQEHNLSPHGWLTKHVDCEGSGQCSACAVEVDQGGGDPDQWLDAFLASRDMGRLSCQIDVTEDMSIRV